MTSIPEPWTPRIAVALCLASRWLAVGSLALMVLALAAAGVRPAGHTAEAAILIAVAAAGALHLYLAVRIEFDRTIFAALAAAPDLADAVKGFDDAMRALALMPPRKAGRTLADRVAGLRSLVMRAGWLFAVQVALSMAAVWMQR